MSIKYLNAAFDANIPAVKKLVLLALADYADEQGIAYPSITTLMRKTSLKKDAVINAIKTLIDSKFLIKITNDHIPALYLKRNNQNCYQLILQQETVVAQRDRSVLAIGRLEQPSSVACDEKLSVDQTDLNHQLKSPINLKKKNKSLFKPNFFLTEDLVVWGAEESQKWTREEMQIHFDFFTDYLANRVRKYKDPVAAFRNCVRGNWANIKKEASEKNKPKQDLIAEYNQASHKRFCLKMDQLQQGEMNAGIEEFI